MTREAVADAHVRLERLMALAKTLEADCAESVSTRHTLEQVLREIDALRHKLTTINLP
jgi:hypothetical protein